MINKVIKSCRHVLQATPYWQVIQSRDEQLEENLYARIKMSNNTYKRTYSGRLDEVNEEIVGLISSMNLEEVYLMDVGASSGITTLEWHEQLKEEGIQAKVIATDAFIDAYQVKVVPNFFEIILDYERKLIEYNVGSMVFQGLMYCPLSMLIYPVAKLFIYLAQWQMKGKISVFEIKQIELIHSAFNNKKDIKFIKDDIINDKHYIGQIDCLRASNILNKGYFDKSTLLQIIGNLKARLKEGGLFVVTRTHLDKQNHASIFQLVNNQFLLLKDIGDGSEVKPLILQTSTIESQ